MRTLYIISKGINKPSDEEIIQLEQNRMIPRGTLLEQAISAELLDERYLMEKTPLWRRFFYRFFSTPTAQIVEALFIVRRYDAVMSHSEIVGLPLSLLMKYLRIYIPHILVISRITSVYKSKKKQKFWFIKRTKDVVSRYLIWSSRQRDIAINSLGIDPDKIILLKRGTDQKFWNQKSPATDIICSVGMEARDYPTLIEAVKALDIPIYIATGQSRGELFDTVQKLYDIKDLPDNVTVVSKSRADLRDLYARSRFTVVSLIPTDSDNGLTTILESMAMGKPVICSRAEGQVDVIQDGVTGIFVPLGDPRAMRQAITELWNNPLRCEEMGRAGREYIEKHHTLEQFVNSIKQEILISIEEHQERKLPELNPANAVRGN